MNLKEAAEKAGKTKPELESEYRQAKAELQIAKDKFGEAWKAWLAHVTKTFHGEED